MNPEGSHLCGLVGTNFRRPIAWVTEIVGHATSTPEAPRFTGRRPCPIAPLKIVEGLLLLLFDILRSAKLQEGRSGCVRICDFNGEAKDEIDPSHLGQAPHGADITRNCGILVWSHQSHLKRLSIQNAVESFLTHTLWKISEKLRVFRNRLLCAVEYPVCSAVNGIQQLDAFGKFSTRMYKVCPNLYSMSHNVL